MKYILIALLLTLPLQVNGIDLSDTLDKLPDAKQGMVYSIVDSEIKYATTFQVAKFKDFLFSIGYAGEDEGWSVHAQ